MAHGQAARVRFLRHLGAASLVVAVVVVLGLAWNHFASGTLIGTLHGPGQVKVVPGGHGLRLRPGARALPRRINGGGPAGHGVVQAGGMNLGLNSMFQSVNLPYLKHTLVIEAAVITGVALLDAGRRKLRRVKRARRLRAHSPSETRSRLSAPSRTKSSDTAAR